jgi:hypothetical protein
MTSPELHAREADAVAARERFMTTLHAIQHRLSPKTVTGELKEKAREKVDGVKAAAKEGVVQAATHPSTVAAITVPILVYLFRKPLARGLGTLLGKDLDETPQTQPYQEARSTAPPSAEPARARKAPAEQGA